MRILLTGGTGFVGRAIADRIMKSPGWELVAASRSGAKIAPINAVVPDLDENTNWQSALEGVNVVIHSAARVHVLNETAADQLMAYRRTNVAGTLNFARQAANAGVERFIFISSVKVNGEVTTAGRPFCADDVPHPADPYGVSKMEAEQGLREIASATGLKCVIIRPPLVYGPRVKANFLSMMRWLWRGVPLPLGAIVDNRRSLVFLDNVVDLIVTCIDHPEAPGQTFMVSDDQDLSTVQLLRQMGDALGKPARLIPVPVGVLRRGASLLGKEELAQRLCDSLQVDIGKTRRVLGWKPPYTLDQGLEETAMWYKRSLG